MKIIAPLLFILLAPISAYCSTELSRTLETFSSACESVNSSQRLYDNLRDQADRYCGGDQNCLRRQSIDAHRTSRISEAVTYFTNVMKISAPLFEKQKRKITDLDILTIRRCYKNSEYNAETWDILKRNKWID